MRIWIITAGEQLPTDGENVRLLRTGLLTKALLKRGHEVTRWTSTFNHTQKRHRFIEDTTEHVEERYTIRFLHSIAYPRNVSFRRLINYHMLAKRFSRYAPDEPGPDIILSSLPTLDFCLAATKFGVRYNIPVVIDVRDLWPESFLDLVPSGFKWIARILLIPMYMMTRIACSRATAICAHTQPFLDRVLTKAGRPGTSLDRVFPMGYEKCPPESDALAEAVEFWRRNGIDQGTDEFIVCFFGTMGRQITFDAVIHAARILESSHTRIRFVLCGAGDKIDDYKRMADGCENISFPGWVGAAEIWMLMQMSSVGLAPYKNTTSFLMSIANKPIEYMSAGLPVVTSLRGILKRLIEEHDCGLYYSAGRAEGLASLLVNLYENPERLRIMSDNAIALYESRFTAEQVYDQMSSYLEEIPKTSTDRN